jgi:putative hydrolase of the HAD superfamily
MDTLQASSFHAIVFDLDDTLFAERDYVMSGFQAIDKWLVAHYKTKGFSQIAQDFFEQGIRGKIFDMALAQMHFPLSTKIVQEMLAVYRNHTPSISLDKEIIAFLEKLKKHKRTGVITDGYWETQKKKVESLTLASFVDAIVFSDEWGREAWKPSEKPFREMEKRLNVSPESCLYIGDNPEKDFIGARNAGWKSLRLAIPGREHSSKTCTLAQEPDCTLSSWHELIQQLN